MTATRDSESLIEGRVSVLETEVRSVAESVKGLVAVVDQQGRDARAGFTLISERIGQSGQWNWQTIAAIVGCTAPMFLALGLFVQLSLAPILNTQIAQKEINGTFHEQNQVSINDRADIRGRLAVVSRDVQWQDRIMCAAADKFGVHMPTLPDAPAPGVK